MNRKERRFAEKTQEKKTGFKPAPAAAATKAEMLKMEGLALRAAGKEAEAIPVLTEALKLNSALADVHFLLAIMARMKPELNIDMAVINRGIKNKIELKTAYKAIQDILRERKQRAENLICQEEICRLLPDDNNEKAEYALMLSRADRREEAVKIMADLLNADPANKVYKGIFVSLIDQVFLNHYEPGVRQALLHCFENIYETNLYKAFSVWLNLIIRDPGCIGLRSVSAQVSDADFYEWLLNAPPEQSSFARDPFFLNGIRLLIIGEITVENLLARMRRGLCLNIETLTAKGRIKYFELFLSAMGEQSFFNEYIYSQPDDEKAVIENMILKIRTGIPTNIEAQHAYSLISCYQPLYSLFPDRKKELQELSDQSADFAKLFKTQFLDIEEENIIKPQLASFGRLENEISKNVQSQYEENPYPRWVSCVNYPVLGNSLPVDEKYRRNAWKILVAGCGTGRHALFTAATFPNAHVTAIDISRASLAYAQRKAHESGMADRVKFIHADILNMDQWPEQFDIIESSGVLHHMEDPLKGWQILCDRLKPGGYFKVGLYSEIARREIADARQYVKDLGFESTLEGIRACREAIKKRPDTDDIKKWLIDSADFFTTSSLRDLIFHVQEHRMNLPQLQGMLNQLGLVCTKFIITEADIALQYDTQFPDDPDRKSLVNWHEFEQKNPKTFRAMYQFWSQKQ